MASAAERLGDGASEEKKIRSAHDHVEDPGQRHTIENLPDPDAGLSEEERAAHVHCPSNTSGNSTDTCIGSQTPQKTRPQAHPLAVLPIPHLLPRPHQYWQCEARRLAARFEND